MGSNRRGDLYLAVASITSRMATNVRPRCWASMASYEVVTTDLIWYTGDGGLTAEGTRNY